MKMTKTHIKLLAIAILPMLVAGCLNDLFEQRDRTYQGDPLVEFAPSSRSVTEDSAATFQTTAAIQLIGEQRDAAISVSYSVDPSSSAVEDTHYRLLTGSPTSIPANSSSAEVNIEVLDSAMEDGDDPVQLILVLDSADGIELAANYTTFTLTISGD